VWPRRTTPRACSRSISLSAPSNSGASVISETEPAASRRSRRRRPGRGGRRPGDAEAERREEGSSRGRDHARPDRLARISARDATRCSSGADHRRLNEVTPCSSSTRRRGDTGRVGACEVDAAEAVDPQVDEARIAIPRRRRAHADSRDSPSAISTSPRRSTPSTTAASTPNSRVRPQCAPDRPPLRRAACAPPRRGSGQQGKDRLALAVGRQQRRSAFRETSVASSTTRRRGAQLRAR
jgi:hypothetical protein